MRDAYYRSGLEGREATIVLVFTYGTHGGTKLFNHSSPRLMLSPALDLVIHARVIQRLSYVIARCELLASARKDSLCEENRSVFIRVAAATRPAIVSEVPSPASSPPPAASCLLACLPLRFRVW